MLARLQSLRRLSVSLRPDQQPHETYWTRLAALTELCLACLGSPPAGLGGMTGLRSIIIMGHPFERSPCILPAGPYLSRLESLRICLGASFETGVPAVLAAAVQLRHLDLGMIYLRVRLTAADVSVLGALPSFITLRLEKPNDLDQHAWDERVAQLRAAFIAQGRAPPAVLGFHTRTSM